MKKAVLFTTMIAVLMAGALCVPALAAKDVRVYVPLKGEPAKSTDETVENTFRWEAEFEEPVWAMAVSPDGKLAAVGLNDGKVDIYDTQSGQKAQELEAHRKRVYAIAFSPDGRLLATSGHDEQVVLWDTSTWQELGKLDGVEQIMYSLAFSPDSKTLVTGSRKIKIHLWDVASRSERAVLENHDHLVSALAFSPDGKMLASGSYDRTVVLWDWPSSVPRQVLEHRYPVYSLAFSPSGKYLAVGTKDSEITIWDTLTGTEYRKLEGHDSLVYSLAFSPDGNTLISGSHDRSIRIWDVRTGEEKRAIVWDKQRGDTAEQSGHRSAVKAVAFSPDGRVLYSGGLDRKMFAWDATVKGKSVVKSFKKGEFETTAEYEKRLKSFYLPYTSPATLSRYNADRGGYNVMFADHEVFVKVPREVARQMKARSTGLRIEGLMGYHDEETAELINAELVDDVLGVRYPFGRQVKGAVAAVSAPGTPAFQKAGAPKLTYTAALSEENGDSILEGGERVSLAVTVKNTGEGSAIGVNVELEGDPTLLRFIGSSKSIGHIPPGTEQTVKFESVLPTELKAGNADVRISVREARGYSATEVKVIAVAMKPAAIKETTKVLSELTDVDIVPKAIRGNRCDDCLAVIVGISRYRSDAVPEVKYARRDAEAVSRYLQAVGGVPRENVKLLVDDSATRADIASTVEEWLPRRVKPDSTVFVYYAGHGTPDPKTNKAYIVPYEGEAGYLKKLYPLDQLYKSLNGLDSRQVVVMLDSCFSGSGERSVIPEGARPMALSVENPVLAGKKVAVLAASKGDQISSDYDRAGHGLFTYYLLKGFKGEADADRNGRVELEELYGYVSSNVSSTAARELNRDQNPVLLPGLENIKGRDITVTRVK
jgi:WD40 repeat protein